MRSPVVSLVIRGLTQGGKLNRRGPTNQTQETVTKWQWISGCRECL